MAAGRRIDMAELNSKMLHVSYRSDHFSMGDDVIGLVIWRYKGRDDWQVNGVHCKSGYIYLT